MEFGEQKNFRENLASARKTRATTESYREHENETFQSAGRPWQLYGRSIVAYIPQFRDAFPDAVADLRRRLDLKIENGEKPLVVDLAGGAGGGEENIDAISATLQTEFTDEEGKRRSLTPMEGQTLVAADLLTHDGQQKLLEQVEAAGKPVSFVFCAPMGGATDYRNNPYAGRKVDRMISALYGHLEPGGGMFLNFRYLADSMPDIEAALEETDADVQRSGESFLVTKPDNA